MKRKTLENLFAGVAATAAFFILTVSTAFADGYGQSTCTSGYGDSVVCSDEETVIVPVEDINTGIAENVIVATGLFALGYVALAYVQKQNSLRI